MAKEADIDIVRAGTDSIREYRKSHAGWDRPFDLSGADLRGLYLEGADLGGADLSRADLDRAILSDCNLSQANLTEATLTHAAFIRCRFRETVLCGANANLAAFLLRDAMARTLAASLELGIRVMLVHALDESARDFYLHHGFELSHTDSMNLQLLVKDIEASLDRGD
jgi:hypothetical protein